MLIRYKFRSAVSFDEADIGERAGISVRELKAMIIAIKHLNLWQGFDLIFFDHLTGKEYNDENYQIPSNSSVIIKRVPAVSSVPPPLLGGQKLQYKEQENVKPTKRLIDRYELAEKNASLPSELRCPICAKFLKEAVMTPCCHRSFCDICIRGVLSVKSKCPKCSSDILKAGDLIPNVSLRLAINSFLESQIEFPISETVLRRYVPDGESGIFPSATQKVPNRLLGGYFIGESKTGYHPDLAEEGQGENYFLNSSRNPAQDKGANIKVSDTAKYRKADRTCYMCNAPDHFIRDCPFANGPHPWLQTGNSMYAAGPRPTFAAPYWNNTAYAPMRPFPNIYANHGMIPYNASMFPVSPIGVSPYMASINPNSGFPRMDGMAPLAGNRTENAFRHEDYLETHNFEIRGNHSKEYMMRVLLSRRQPSDNGGDNIQKDRHNLPKSSQEYLFHAERKNSGSYSGEKHTRRSRGNDLHAEHFDRKAHSLHDRHGKNSRSLTGTRVRKAYYAQRSNSGEENMSNSSDRHVDERHNHRHQPKRKRVN